MDPITIAMMAMSAAQAIDQAQRAKNQQVAEVAKMRFSPWTKMEGSVVAMPNSPIMEAIGGYIKGKEYEQAQQRAEDQKNYLAARTRYLESKTPPDKKAIRLEDGSIEEDL